MAKQRTYRSLDHTATQAAVYPSEEQLWATGPNVTDPGGQGVMVDAGPMTPPQVTEDWLHEVMNGETSNAVWHEDVVNLHQFGPTGIGPYNNEGVFETGHSQIVVSNPAAEQGWGVGPARRWAHYPVEESRNHTRNMGQHNRNGQLPWVTESSSYYLRTQLAWEQQWSPYKYRSPVAPVVPLADSVPFVETVPTYSGGPSPHPGVDVPMGDALLYGVYPT